MKPLPPFIRAAKLARRIGVDRRTVVAWIRSGSIEGRSFLLVSGRHSWFVSREAYLSLVAKPVIATP